MSMVRFIEASGPHARRLRAREGPTPPTARAPHRQVEEPKIPLTARSLEQPDNDLFAAPRVLREELVDVL